MVTMKQLTEREKEREGGMTTLLNNTIKNEEKWPWNRQEREKSNWIVNCEREERRVMNKDKKMHSRDTEMWTDKDEAKINKKKGEKAKNKIIRRKESLKYAIMREMQKKRVREQKIIT